MQRRDDPVRLQIIRERMFDSKCTQLGNPPRSIAFAKQASSAVCVSQIVPSLSNIASIVDFRRRQMALLPKGKFAVIHLPLRPAVAREKRKSAQRFVS
jgi:hypothetical protein